MTAERGLSVAVSLVLVACLSGCAIADRSDKFGADLEIGVGGILGYIADLHLKGSVGFSKTCTHEKKESQDEEGAGAPVDPFLHWL